MTLRQRLNIAVLAVLVGTGVLLIGLNRGVGQFAAGETARGWFTGCYLREIPTFNEQLIRFLVAKAESMSQAPHFASAARTPEPIALRAHLDSALAGMPEMLYLSPRVSPLRSRP